MSTFLENYQSIRCFVWNQRGLLVRLVIFVGVLIWIYGTTLYEMAQRWSHDPRYSHGYLVPLMALALLWVRRGRLSQAEVFKPSWWGIPLIGLGIAMRFTGVFIFFNWLDAISLLPCLAGISVLLGGRRVLNWAWPAIVFLVFMIPLPFRVERALGGPLQSAATQASAYTLQVLGLPALTEGNVIVMNQGRIGVIDACNGLGMMYMFLAVSTAVAFLIRNPLIDKLIIIASAVPIAFVSNLVRITVTGVLQETVGGETAHVVYHDLAGWLMMPLALGILWIELRLLANLFLESGPRHPMPLEFGRSAIPRNEQARISVPPR